MAGVSASGWRRSPRSELRAIGEDALYVLELVRDVLVRRHGGDLRLKTYAVVSVGFDRLAGREVPESLIGTGTIPPGSAIVS